MKNWQVAKNAHRLLSRLLIMIALVQRHQVSH